MRTFTSIDFETATGKRSSICQIGLVRVEDGHITERLSILVQPPGNEYSQRNIDIHGITPDQTEAAPTFADVWPTIVGYLQGQQVVAHSSAFDFDCLGKTMDHYQLGEIEIYGNCTYKLFGKKLAELCDEYGIEITAHDALSDALACAQLYIIHLDRN